MWNQKGKPISSRYESKHAKDRRRERKIRSDKVDAVIQRPDKRIVTQKGVAEHYKKDHSTGLWTKAIVRFGPALASSGAACVIGAAPVAGVAIGMCVLIITYYQTSKV